MSIYCLLCKTGREEAVKLRLAQEGRCVIAPRVVVNSMRPGGVVVSEQRVLLPGYVFLDSREEPDWQTLKANAGILRPLSYAGGERALRGRDFEFVRFLDSTAGFLGMSRAVREGTRIRVIDGPLKTYEGSNIRVNSRRRAAEVLIDREGIVHTIWLPYQVLEEVKR